MVKPQVMNTAQFTHKFHLQTLNSISQILSLHSKNGVELPYLLMTAAWPGTKLGPASFRHSFMGSTLSESPSMLSSGVNGVSSAQGPTIIVNKKNSFNISCFSHLQVIEFDDGSGSVLRIQPLRTPRDEAIYECVASNSVGETSATTKLSVLRGRC